MHCIHVAYCYIRLAFYGPYVFLCAGHISEPCRTAKLTEMPSGVQALVGSKNHVLLHKGENWQHIVNTTER